jgi:phosphoribosylaminoimidazole-succinocarboxamide synthase
MREKLYEGKAKIIYTTDDPEVLVMHFKDDATAFNGLKKGTIVGKGEVNCAVTSAVCKLLESSGVPTHFIERTGANEHLAKRLDMFMIEVVVRNTVAGSLSKRTGLDEGTEIPNGPLVELYYKSDELNDPMINDEHARCWGWASAEELAEMKAKAFKVNEVLVGFFEARNIRLVDFKLEFGLDKDGNMLLGDEFTADGSRLWELGTDRKMDKDRFRRDLGAIEETYREVLGLVEGPGAGAGAVQ